MLYLDNNNNPPFCCAGHGQPLDVSVGHTDHFDGDEESSQNLFFLFLANDDSLGSNAFICVATDLAKFDPLLTLIFIF